MRTFSARRAVLSSYGTAQRSGCALIVAAKHGTGQMAPTTKAQLLYQKRQATARATEALNDLAPDHAFRRADRERHASRPAPPICSSPWLIVRVGPHPLPYLAPTGGLRASSAAGC
jgi:hypothetical protein